VGLQRRAKRALGTLVACVFLLAPPAGASAETIVVDTVEDDFPTIDNGNCSLREAIESVDAAAEDACVHTGPVGPDTIVFGGLAPGNQLISADQHFILSKTMTIDASGFAGEIRIDGAGANASFRDDGIQPRADGIVLKGLSITNWAQTGVRVDLEDTSSAADNVEVIDNFIGTDESGTAGLGNFSTGVAVGQDNGFSYYQPANTVISGNVISGNGVGINVRGADTDNTTIKGNLIGTNPAGTAALANTTTGVQVGGNAHNVMIGGGAAGDGNVISGNGGQGVLLTATPAPDRTTDVTVQGNTIGLGTNGATLGNGTSGVAIVGDVDNTEIRDSTISANGGPGVSIDDNPGTGPDDTLIEGSRIGTNPSGTAVRANSSFAVLVGGNGSGPVGTIIGGDTAGGGGACADLCNVIAGTGISITQTAGSGTEVLGNHIGVNQPGTGGLAVSGAGVTVTHADDVIIGSVDGPNTIGTTATAGVRMQGDVGGGTIQSNLFGTRSDGTGDLGNTNLGIELQGADGVLIGGLGNGEGNLIANNGADGVRVSGLGTTANAIVGNSIHDNGGLGIDLEDPSGFGPTPNDAGDGDLGANGLQNFVDLGLVVRSNSFRLVGDLDSTPNTFFRVEVFINSTPHPSGFGDGEILTDSFEVETDGSGSESIDRVVPGNLSGGRTASVTVTELDGPGGNPVQTSEFSPPAAHGFCGDTQTSAGLGLILGTAGEDTLTGTAADDILCGLGNNDVLDGRSGDDLLIGGDDSSLDMASFAAAPGPVTVDLAAGTATGDGVDELIGIESIEGGPFADTLSGDGGVNEIISGNGADQIDPRGGPDAVNGGPGDDTITIRDGGGDNQIRCGPGNDTLIADTLAFDLPINIFDCETVDRPGPPQLSLSGKKKQKSKSKVVVEAACANEGCTLVAKGTIKIKVPKKKRAKKNRAAPAKSKKLKLKTARATADAGQTKKLKLKLSRKAKKLLKEVIRKKTSKATVKATATDGVGNASPTQKLKIKVKKRKK
jgi:CSLREA domain-containing protein